MQLYFLRHGEADWPDWKKSDDERPLTDFGKKEVRDVAKFLAHLKVRPDLIVTSPLFETEIAEGRIARARLWNERVGDHTQATSLKSFDAGRSRTGLYQRDFGIDWRFAQAFESRRRLARCRS